MARVKKFIARWFVPQGFLDLYTMLDLRQKQSNQLFREETSLLQENSKLKNRHVGQRCFILGAGSSVKKQDLTKLAGEMVISVSNTFVHKDFSLFRPKYHVLPPVLAYHSNFATVDKYMEWFAEIEKKTFGAEMFFHIGDRIELIKHNLFKDRIVHWVAYESDEWDEKPIKNLDLAKIPGIWSVSETALTVALYLGFDKIYLLGFDHDWFNGPFVYFYDEKKDHVVPPDKAKTAFLDSEFQMRRHARIFKKYKYLYSLKQNIYNANANRESYVDVFPKVSLGDVLGK